MVQKYCGKVQRQHDVVATVGDADIRLGRCVGLVGNTMSVEFKDGYGRRSIYAEYTHLCHPGWCYPIADGFQLSSTSSLSHLPHSQAN